jgi:EmrB/QacA subfamily drug resistance transporter
VLSWVVTAYGVLFAALLTPAGRLADVVGRKRVFLGGAAAFGAASALSAVAPSVGALIAARALQGAAAAVTIPAALGLVLASAPEEKRVQAVGLWGATASLSAAAGPTLGGLLIEAFDWRAVFVINIPIIAVTLIAGLRALPDVRPTERRLPDLGGTLALAAGLGLVVVGLTKAGDWGWTGAATLALLAGGAALLAFSLLRARRHPAPAIETSLWRSRMFGAANLTSLVMGGAMYSWMLACVLFVTSVWHYSILDAGLAVSPGAISSAVAAVIAGLSAERLGYRQVVAFGALLLVGCGVWCALALGPTPNFLGFWLPAGLVSGVAFGTAMTGLASAASVSVPSTRFAAGSGLNLTARQVGGALGVAVLATILTSQGLGVGAFRDVFIFCTVAAALAALTALRLTRGREEEPGVSNS